MADTELRDSHPSLTLTEEIPVRLVTAPAEPVGPTEAAPEASMVAPPDVLCRCCEVALSEPSEFELCSECAALVFVETDELFEQLGPLGALGTPNRVDEAKGSLRVLYASTFLGTNADRIARFLGVSRTVTRQYAMRFRAANIWENGGVDGPWSKKVRLSPVFCRLFFMDALVGAGQVIRRKNRWEFLDGPAEA